MTRVLTFGVFDFFHIGHLNFLEKCREYGDYLIVGVQQDEYAAALKPGQSILYHTGERVEMVKALRVVDEVFVYDTLRPETMETADFDILALGEDHIGERFDVIEAWCNRQGKTVIRLPRTPEISSTLIRERLIKNIQKA